MPESLVEIDAVEKRFAPGERLALDGVTARIEPGQILGIVGPDGAGKTTLMRLMAGLLVPTAGKLVVCGYDPVTQSDEVHQAVSYMPQRFGLYEDLTVQENLNLFADLQGVVGDDRRQAFERMLTFTGLRPFTDRLAGRLSGGMKQKLGLACALVRKPMLLLLDEPSVGVDPVSRRELWRMVHELAEQGIGVVWSTSYLDEAERCTAVLALNEGRSLYRGPPEALTRRMEGRSFLLRNAAFGRHEALTRALRRPEVIDGVIQGSSVRLVLREDSPPLAVEQLGVGGAAELVPARPRFEDAFIALLGGVPKGRATDETELLGSGERAALTSGPDAAVVEARALTKRFGDFTAADQISFAIRRGEVFGLLGPNGAGKSTVFKMLCGLLRPTAGTARVAGVDLVRAPSKARGRLGYMAQKFSLYGDLSVRQNLVFFSGVYGLAGHAQRAAIDRMTDALGLAPYLDVNSGALPLGFKQRLALACAVMHAPPVLFLDEPTSGVDPLTRREFWDRINSLVGRGVTVMVTTHFLDEAEYCDRIAMVYRGQVIAAGTPDELKERVRNGRTPDPTLEDAFIALVEEHDAALAAKENLRSA